jgi:Heterodisulfide reductase, subunit A and related polyferredoxins
MNEKQTYPIAIIGGGPVGMEAAGIIAEAGLSVSLFEAKSDWAENLNNKYKVFPDFTSAEDLFKQLKLKIDNEQVSKYLNTEISGISKSGNLWLLKDNNGNEHKASAVLLSTGYEVFDAERKEELGYGIYDGVITSLQLEKMLKTQQIKTVYEEAPQRIVFLQCVGSRDEKTGNRYCSKICCITAVKQAIEVKKLLPQTEIFVFYMDLRMWGQNFEELYRESQEQYNVRYVRGRISEASSTFDGRIQIKAEDTLIGKPLKMSTDLLVLMVGMEPSCGTKDLSKCCGISGEYGFARSKNPHLNDNMTDKQGLFVAGSCKRPMSIKETITDARSAALDIIKYIGKPQQFQNLITNH